MTELPCKECGGQCCTFPAFSPQEFKKIKKKYGFPEGVAKKKIKGLIVLYGKGGYCPYLIDNECSVYDLRPLACRAYGVVKEMPCKYLYPEAAQKEFKAMWRDK